MAVPRYLFPTKLKLSNLPALPNASPSRGPVSAVCSMSIADRFCSAMRAFGNVPVGMEPEPTIVRDRRATRFLRDTGSVLGTDGYLSVLNDHVSDNAGHD